MIKFWVYRHKTEKDIYLARNWNICGGGENTEFYYATNDLNRAIEDANRGGFLSWIKSFDGKLKAKITLQKEMDFDGYKGRLSKEIAFKVSDFEPIALVEAEKE